MTIAIWQLQVPLQHRAIPQGQTVLIMVEVRDVGLTSVLLEPSLLPVISIFDPNNVAIVTDIPMEPISLGRYSYAFQTTTDNDVGAYAATVTAVSGLQVARVEKSVVFRVVRSSTLVSFTYFAIQDQDNVVWYWYVGSDNTLWTSLTIPSIIGKQAVPWLPIVIPHWLEISNPVPQLRYIYPAVTGEVTVETIQLPSGSGMIGSPLLAGVAGGNFRIALNVSDEITLVTVV